MSVWGIKDEYFEKVYPQQMKRRQSKEEKEEAERNKTSLRSWYMKYHPNCEIADHAGALNAPKRVVFTMTGCVTICDECYERLGVKGLYKEARPHLKGVLPALPLAPQTGEHQTEMDLGGC
jgi:hypothetical protein